MRTDRGFDRCLPRAKRALRAAALLVAGSCLGAVLAGSARPALAQEENLLERISNERMIEFERKLEQDLHSELRRFLSPAQYVLSVRVIWDRNILPPSAAPELAPEKQKLPGFPIFVRSPGAPVDDKTPPFTRLTVKVLLDETLPDYYERFFRKIVPIVARFVPERGDQLVVLKETFPELKREDKAAPLSEQELMGRLPEPLPPAAPPSAAPEPKTERMGPAQEARIAFDEGRYEDALRIVRQATQRARTNEERAQYLAMEGSILYTTNNRAAAKAAWQRALTYNPGDQDVLRVLEFLESRPNGGGTQ
jgi:tetratricopeptide (TPR) repeat protein